MRFAWIVLVGLAACGGGKEEEGVAIGSFVDTAESYTCDCADGDVCLTVDGVDTECVGIPAECDASTLACGDSACLDAAYALCPTGTSGTSCQATVLVCFTDE